jgi:putative transposase
MPFAYSCVEAACVSPVPESPPVHDAFTRLLRRLEPEPEALWREVAPHVDRSGGVLVVDDSTLDKPYARKMGLVGRHGSGKHRAVVQGISLVTLQRLWPDPRIPNRRPKR